MSEKDWKRAEEESELGCGWRWFKSCPTHSRRMLFMSRVKNFFLPSWSNCREACGRKGWVSIPAPYSTNTYTYICDAEPLRTSADRNTFPYFSWTNLHLSLNLTIRVYGFCYTKWVSESPQSNSGALNNQVFQVDCGGVCFWCLTKGFRNCRHSILAWIHKLLLSKLLLL